MVESDLNRIINASFNRYGFNHKISDFKQGQGVQNPFDHFGEYNGMPSYMEAKLIKNKISSFNFNKIEVHQYAKLEHLDRAYSATIPDKYLTLYPIGFYKPKSFFKVIFFSHSTIRKIKESGKNSILAKELNKLIEQNNYLNIEYEPWVNPKTGKKSRKQFIQNLDRLLDVIV